MFFIAVGQCGNQIGGSFWPLVLQEHGIKIQKENSKTQTSCRSSQEKLLEAFHSFFWSPHGIWADDLKNLADLEEAKIKARVNLYN